MKLMLFIDSACTLDSRGHGWELRGPIRDVPPKDTFRGPVWTWIEFTKAQVFRDNKITPTPRMLSFNSESISDRKYRV